MSQAESPLYKLLRKQSLAFLAAAVLASVCLILIGAMVEARDTLSSRLLLTLGSSGLGTCLGLVFGSLTGSSALHRVKDLVEKTLSSALHAAEDELQPLRRVWHHYLVTRIEGRAVWRYRQIDFSRTIVPGKLLATLTVPGPNNRPHTYTIEAFVAAPRAVFVQKSTRGAEAPAIHIYPFATEHFRAVIAGAAYLQTWDGNPLGVPVLMSETPIDLGVEAPAEGTLPEAAYAKLDALWSKQAAQLGLIVNGRT